MHLNYMEITKSYILTLSSSLFIIPGTYVLIYKKSIFSIITYSVSIASVNYWLDPSNQNKLFYDKLTTYTACFLYIANSLYYMPTIQLKFITIMSVFLYYLFYRLSCHLYRNNNPNWVYAHFLFHLLVNLSKWLLYLNL